MTVLEIGIQSHMDFLTSKQAFKNDFVLSKELTKIHGTVAGKRIYLFILHF